MATAQLPQTSCPRPAAAPWCWRERFRAMFGLDVRSLALFRIGLGFYLLVDLLLRVPDLTIFHTDAGVLPRLVLGPPWCLPFHRLSGDLWWQVCLFVIAGLFAVALLLGYRTRLATLVSWLLLLSLHDRNPDILQGGDQLARLILFWGFFLPLGACWSLDRLLEKSRIENRRSKIEEDGNRPSSSILPPPSSLLSPRFLVVSGLTAAYVVQVCIVYWFAAALKIKNSCWWGDNTAVYYALNIASFDKPAGKFLLGLHSAELLRFLTAATVLLEGLGPLLLFVPVFQRSLRLLVVLSFILFHTCLGICMELGPFPYVACLAWAALLPGCFWDGLAALRQRWQRTAPDQEHEHQSGPARQEIERPAWWVQGLAVVLVVYMFLCNVRSLNPEFYGRFLPAPLDWLGRSFALNQMWGMFTPSPGENSGWYVIRGTLRDGSVVNLFHEDEPATWDRPAWVSATYPNEHWRKYLMNLGLSAYQRNRSLYARYLCRSWNARHEGEKRLEYVEIYFVLERTPPDFAPPRAEPSLYCRCYCDVEGGPPTQ
jgi:hypothetical protein